MKTASKSRTLATKAPRQAPGTGASDGRRLELGQHIVADPLICHGQPTFKGTRIMVWQILDELAHGMSPAQIVKAWGGRIRKPAIFEAVALARQAVSKPHRPLIGEPRFAGLPGRTVNLYDARRRSHGQKATRNQIAKRQLARLVAV